MKQLKFIGIEKPIGEKESVLWFVNTSDQKDFYFLPLQFFYPIFYPIKSSD